MNEKCTVKFKNGLGLLSKFTHLSYTNAYTYARKLNFLSDICHGSQCKKIRRGIFVCCNTCKKTNVAEVLWSK